jgi:DNA polymerase-3 subunit alpha
MYLIFDTETTGIPRNKTAPLTDFDNWPRLVQIAWQLHDGKGRLISAKNLLVKPDGFDIPYKAEQIHGISTKRAMAEGHDLIVVLQSFLEDLAKTNVIVGHNIEFDINIIGAEFLRKGFIIDDFLSLSKVDTGLVSIDFCKLSGGPGGKYKFPKLNELHEKLFSKGFDDAHDAAYDVAATARCFFGLLSNKVTAPFDSTPISEIEYEEPNLEAANFSKKEKKKQGAYLSTDDTTEIAGTFCHLHVHSQFSVLQATPEIKTLIEKTKAAGMPAIAITDLGNMYGAFKFVK